MNRGLLGLATIATILGTETAASAQRATASDESPSSGWVLGNVAAGGRALSEASDRSCGTVEWTTRRAYSSRR
jgi:hypothetical protein